MTSCGSRFRFLLFDVTGQVANCLLLPPTEDVRRSSQSTGEAPPRGGLLGGKEKLVDIVATPKARPQVAVDAAKTSWSIQ